MTHLPMYQEPKVQTNIWRGITKWLFFIAVCIVLVLVAARLGYGLIG